MVKVVDPVLSASELVARTRELLGREPAPATTRGNGPRRELAVDRHLPELHAAIGGLGHPSTAAARRGMVGRSIQLVKKSIRRATAWYVEPRWTAQAAFDRHVTSMVEDLAAFQRQVARSHEDLATHTAALSEQAADVTDRLMLLQDELAAALARPTAPDIDYVAFEERFRGSSSQVKDNQREYVSRFESAFAPGPVIDIGCGRGEMLELLRDAGIAARGLDLDADMLDVCRSKGLDVEEGEAIGWLRNCPDDSLRGIFLAQVVEHLPTDELVELVRLAAAKIGPGGAFVAETIDPRSLYATANFFWADLSHVRPVHPATLAFLAEQAGFAQVGVVRRSRHELADLGSELPDGPVKDAVLPLLEEVYGYQDYAVVANR